MAFTKATDYNYDNNKIYINWLNSTLGLGINTKTVDEWTLFLEAVVTPTFAKIYNESKEVKNNNSPINDYDVNEFRGDAIIGYIVVTQIIKKDQVGKMDKSKQKLVSNDRLSKIFDLLNFDKFVYTQPN